MKSGNYVRPIHRSYHCLRVVVLSDNWPSLLHHHHIWVRCTCVLQWEDDGLNLDRPFMTVRCGPRRWRDGRAAKLFLPLPPSLPPSHWRLRLESEGDCGEAIVTQVPGSRSQASGEGSLRASHIIVFVTLDRTTMTHCACAECLIFRVAQGSSSSNGRITSHMVHHPA